MRSILLPTPAQLKQEISLSAREKAFVDDARRRATAILHGAEKNIAILVGPCAIHDRASCVEYAGKLSALSERLEAFLVLRCFMEKPRTRFGWKGMLYDPHLDGSNDIAAGLRESRSILVEMARMGMPCAAELLDPLAAPYFDDLLCWGTIGSRTSASQPHRQLASGLLFPVGFKNSTDGSLEEAVSGILSSRLPHSHLGIDGAGRVSAIKTDGNALTHLVLRGSNQGPNFDPASVKAALGALRQNGLEPRLLIDCSHGNSRKDPLKQKIAFQSALAQMGSGSIIGLMLESHLFAGNQPLGENLRYGVSVSDPCLGWDETEELLLSMSMSCVQK